MVGLLRRVPEALHRVAFRWMLRHLTREVHRAGLSLEALDGKRFHLVLTDLGKTYPFSVRQGALEPLPQEREQETPDVVLRGRLEDFLALLRGKVDADALFFSRRLTILGDAHASTYLKHLLEHRG